MYHRTPAIRLSALLLASVLLAALLVGCGGHDPAPAPIGTTHVPEGVKAGRTK